MTATTIPIDSIIVSDRARTQIAGIDLTALMESLAEHGLLHPVVIDADNQLVAGGRRLRAAKDLGWLEIEATRLGELTERERKIIELEENIRRVDLRDVDRSRLVAQIADLAEQVIAEEGVLFHDETKVCIGRPDKPGSLRDVAERIGKSPATITRARQHVAAVDADPTLIGKSQSDVLKAVTVKRLDRDESTEQKEQVITTIKRVEQEPDEPQTVKVMMIPTALSGGRVAHKTADELTALAETLRARLTQDDAYALGLLLADLTVKTEPVDRYQVHRLSRPRPGTPMDKLAEQTVEGLSRAERAALIQGIAVRIEPRTKGNDRTVLTSLTHQADSLMRAVSR